MKKFKTSIDLYTILFVVYVSAQITNYPWIAEYCVQIIFALNNSCADNAGKAMKNYVEREQIKAAEAKGESNDPTA